MKLKYLAEEYFSSADKCFARAEELQKLLSAKNLSETVRMDLKRRRNALIEMGRETAAMGRYLAGYYEEDTNGRDHKNKGFGIRDHALSLDGTGLYRRQAGAV